MTDSAIFSFQGLNSTVAMQGCEGLYPILSTVLRDWPMEITDPGDDRPPVIRLRKTADGFERRSPWLAEPSRFEDPVDAVCDLIVDLIHAYVAEQASALCLHGAAVELETGLMVFPSTYRAGKSLLSLKLAACGARLFSDDVLPLQAGTNAGTALGILPRLRRPLPETAGGSLRAFIDGRIGPQNTRYRYVHLDTDTLAPRGTEAPVAAITTLRRGSGEPPSLQTAAKGEVVRDMILRNFARGNPAIDILDRLHAVVDRAECYILTYDTLDQAAALLDEGFGIIPGGKRHAKTTGKKAPPRPIWGPLSAEPRCRRKADR